MTPSPGPKPAVALGCFALFVVTLLSVVVLGASFNDAVLTVLLSLVFVALILLLVRIVVRPKPPTPPS